MNEFLLFLAGVGAGTIDAVVGGGGLIGIPALLLYGVAPLQALSTNKLQSVVGKVVATIRYTRAGLLNSLSLSDILLGYVLPCVIWGSLGALCATLMDSAILEVSIPVILLAACAYFLWRAWEERGRNLKDQDTTNGKTKAGKLQRGKFGGGVVMRAIGFYDGIFGPGAGTFFLWMLTGIHAMELRVAVALTRVLNMASNVGALAIFAFAVGFAWRPWLLMVAGQVLGALLGSFIVLRVSVFWLWVLVSAATATMAGVLLVR